MLNLLPMPLVPRWLVRASLGIRDTSIMSQRDFSSDCRNAGYGCSTLALRVVYTLCRSFTGIYASSQRKHGGSCVWFIDVAKKPPVPVSLRLNPNSPSERSLHQHLEPCQELVDNGLYEIVGTVWYIIRSTECNDGVRAILPVSVSDSKFRCATTTNKNWVGLLSTVIPGHRSFEEASNKC